MNKKQKRGKRLVIGIVLNIKNKPKKNKPKKQKK